MTKGNVVVFLCQSSSLSSLRYGRIIISLMAHLFHNLITQSIMLPAILNCAFFAEGRVSSAYVSPYGDQDVEVQVTIHDALQAFIGCPSLPRDITSGLVEFNHKSSSLSVVNTCAPSILFQNTTHLQDFDLFKQEMINIILGTEGFGQE